jgi:uncharacterized protein YfeS
MNLLRRMAYAVFHYVMVGRHCHRTARKLLDAPIYWDLDDYFAPHGNDTGFDLLFEYRRWIRVRGDGRPLDYYRESLSDLDPQNEIHRHVFDEAAVALAFAHIKFRGRCSAELKALAYDAIKRQRDEAIAAVNWKHRDQRFRAMDLFEAKLNQIPE